MSPLSYRVFRGFYGSSPDDRGWVMNYGDLASYLVDEVERRQHPMAIIAIASALSACDQPSTSRSAPSFSLGAAAVSAGAPESELTRHLKEMKLA